MTKRFFTLLSLFCAIVSYGQDQISSPYSYFGIGLPTFHGTAENHAMGGISNYTDNYHFNIQNPASLGALRLTTFTVGASQQSSKVDNGQNTESVKSSGFDYLAVAIPMGKLNFGFGVTPQSSVGYKLENRTETALSRFEGNGGLSKVFLSFGYDLGKNFRIGLEGGYNFGKIKNKSILFQDQVQYGSRETNRSDLGGFSYKFGAQYDLQLNKKTYLNLSTAYSPKSSLTSENERKLATLSINSSGIESIINQKDIDLQDTDFDLPEIFEAGIGIGEKEKWFIGAQYENIGEAAYTNTSFSVNKVKFERANAYRVGGFFVPNPTSLNYLNRIVFRGGARFQETGLRINNETIDEFGISFGLGLPAGPYLSNINLGLEYGERGTTNSNLVKENFVNIFVGISLNDKWFKERKYN